MKDDEEEEEEEETEVTTGNDVGRKERKIFSTQRRFEIY